MLTRLAASCALLSACAEPARDEPSVHLPDIVVVTIDTLRADHVGCYGYFRATTPHLDRLASEAIVFERAMAPMATTLPSHVTLFTGTTPLEHGILANFLHSGRVYEPAEDLLPLAVLLKSAGYETAAFVSALPLRARFGLNSGFDHYSAPTGIPQRRAGETNEEVLAWLDGAHTRPLFLWVHYFDPHSPYEPPPPYDEAFQADSELEAHLDERRIATTAERVHGKENEAARGVDLYDGEVLYTDSELGVLLAALRGRAGWERTVVAVIGDHGEGLNQHSEPGHGLVWEEQLLVPFVLRIPGVEPGRLSSLVSLADFLPTLLGAIDVPGKDRLIEQASGRNVLDPDYEPRPLVAQSSERRKTEFGEEILYALVDERWKLVMGEAGVLQLYDLEIDPFELRDVAGEHPEIAARLRAQLMEELEVQRRRGEALGEGRLSRQPVPDGPRRQKRREGAKLSPEELEQMQALGYTGGEDGR